MLKKGFTLIELLIVVIIIGILASIAVPQFFKVAERARAAEGVEILGAVRRAEIRYYAEHNVLTGSVADLDFENPGAKFFHTIDDSDLLPGGSVKYGVGRENIAQIKRGDTNNRFGDNSYTLIIHGNGDITCSGSHCVSGFKKE